MDLHTYILDGHKAVVCDDPLEWGKWFAGAERRVAVTEGGGIKVSTVFLGLPHGFGPGPPILFETMVFGGEFDQVQERYAAWDEAMAGHEAMCKKVGVGTKKED